jgi:hypothetical protein
MPRFDWDFKPFGALEARLEGETSALISMVKWQSSIA